MNSKRQQNAVFLSLGMKSSSLSSNEQKQQKLNDKNNKMYANLSRIFDCKYFIHAKRVEKSFYGDFHLTLFHCQFIQIFIFLRFDLLA